MSNHNSKQASKRGTTTTAATTNCLVFVVSLFCNVCFIPFSLFARLFHRSPTRAYDCKLKPLASTEWIHTRIYYTTCTSKYNYICIFERLQASWHAHMHSCAQLVMCSHTITGQQSAVRASACQEWATLTVNLKSSYKDFCYFCVFLFRSVFVSAFCNNKNCKCCCCCHLFVWCCIVRVNTSTSHQPPATTTTNVDNGNDDLKCKIKNKCVSIENKMIWKRVKETKNRKKFVARLCLVVGQIFTYIRTIHIDFSTIHLSYEWVYSITIMFAALCENVHIYMQIFKEFYATGSLRIACGHVHAFVGAVILNDFVPKLFRMEWH